MSAIRWITKGLKNFGVGGSTAPPVTLLQSRLPPSPLIGTQAEAISIPMKPKRPMTPYFRFLNEVRPDAVKKNPTLKPTELMKLIGLQWTKLDVEVRDKYALNFKKEMNSFNIVMEKYLKSLTPEQRDAIEQSKITKQLKKEKIEKRHRLLELGKPKKPVTAFLQFLQSKVTAGSGMNVHTAIAKEFGPIWREQMSEEEKAPYVSKYLKGLKEYETILVKWENEMMKQGNDDIVRKKTLTKHKELRK